MLRGALKHAAVHLNHMVEETVQALWTENVHFFTIMCEITFLVGGL